MKQNCPGSHQISKWLAFMWVLAVLQLKWSESVQHSAVSIRGTSLISHSLSMSITGKLAG